MWLYWLAVESFPPVIEIWFLIISLFSTKKEACGFININTAWNFCAMFISNLIYFGAVYPETEFIVAGSLGLLEEVVNKY